MEIIRYSPIGKEDLHLGTGTFEVRLADGRVVTLTKIDVGALLADSTISTQTLTLSAVTLASLNVSGASTLNTVTITGLLSLSSGQIAFPASQLASSDANTLDDYQEGTWTPSVGGTATYTSRSGTYTKIGRLVFLHCSIAINVIGTGSTIQISGVPVASAIVAHAAVNFNEATTSVISVVAEISGSTVTLNSRADAGVTLNSALDVMGDGTLIEFDITYTA